MWLIYLPDNNISIKEPTKFSEEADIKNILTTNSQTSSTSGASYSRDRAIYSCLLTRTNFLLERIASLFPFSLTICLFFLHLSRGTADVFRNIRRTRSMSANQAGRT